MPCLRLFAETLLVERPGSPAREVQTAAASLTFDYDGVRIKGSDLRDHFMAKSGSTLVSRPRAVDAEREARRLLESFGPAETAALEAHGGALLADYVIDPDGDVDTLCTFGAYAVPQLRERGWRIELAPDYPWQTLSAADGWYATALEPERGSGWFDLQLGVEAGGERVNLLPLLVELLEHAPEGMDIDSLTNSCRRLLGLPIAKHTYLAVSPERLGRILSVLLELYRGDGLTRGALRIGNFQGGSLSRLASVFEPGALALSAPEQLLCAGARLVTRGLNASAASPPAVVPDPELDVLLRPYQREGVRWLQHLRAIGVGGVLADDMGLGKTLQAIAHLVVEKAARRLMAPALVVTPTSLVGNWQRELARFAPGLRVVTLRGPRRHEAWEDAANCDVVLTTYPVVLRDEEIFADSLFHIAILDEAQVIKNCGSQIHQAVKRLGAPHRICLTGTPIENHLGELWAIFDFLVPGLLGDAQAFRRVFAQPIEKEGSEARLEALRQRVGPFILRRMKSAVAPELPPKTEIVRAVELTGAQRDLYESIRLSAHEKVRAVVRERGIAGSTVDILDALMKLRQVCCDPRLVRIAAAGSATESAKYDQLFEVLEAQLAEGHRVLVFSQFVTMLDLIGDGLREREIPYVLLSGATQDRQAQVDAFQEGRVQVFLISLKAGGTGLNLTNADTVIHYDPWWNPAVQSQASDRAHRIGQTRPVFVYNLIVAGSVEERILALQKRKRHLAESILTPGDQRLCELSEEEIEGLFAPLGA